MNTATELEIKVGRMPPLEPLPIRTVGKSFKYWIALRAKRRFRFSEDWYVRLPDGEIVVIPEGEETDGASFPWWGMAVVSLLLIYSVDNRVYLVASLLLLAAALKVMFAPLGLALVPGVVHDYLYKHHCLRLADGGSYMKGCTLAQADDLFKRIHLHCNDMMLLAFVTWLGLRAGSWAVWVQHRKAINLQPGVNSGNTA